MIRVKLFKDKQGNIKKYTIEGHAEYKAHGEDIVCAAVSMLSQTTLISLVDVCGLKEKDVIYSIDENIGYLDVNLPINIDSSILEKTQIVLKTLEVGIKSVIESYSRYVTLEYREV